MAGGAGIYIPPHVAEVIHKYQLLKLGVNIPENRLSRWEEEALIIVDNVVEKIKAENMNPDKQPQNNSQSLIIKNKGIGEYCGGESYEKCLETFGDKVLWQVCATCPD